MPFCPKCGKEVSAEANFCPSCGANLKVDKDAAKEFLHEKIAECRHKEILAIIIGLMGLIMQWFFFFRFFWYGFLVFLAGMAQAGITNMNGENL